MKLVLEAGPWDGPQVFRFSWSHRMILSTEIKNIALFFSFSRPDVATNKSPKLVVRWKRPNEKRISNISLTGQESSMDRSLVQLEYPPGSNCCSETLFTK